MVEEPSTFAQYRWIIGVFLASTGSMISNLGLNLQKLTHVRATRAAAQQQQNTAGNGKSNESAANAYYRKPIWVLGLSLVVFGSIADFVALGFAAQTIVAPLGSLTLVTNVVFAPYFSGESLSRSDIVSTMTIVLGSGIAVAFATHEGNELTFDELFRFFTYFRFVVYAIVMTLFISGCYMMIRLIEELQVKAQTSPVAANSFRKLQGFHRLAYGAAAGAVGAQSVLFAKITSELVREGLFSMFGRYETYIILFMLGLTIFLQIKWLNQGLQRFDALYVVPVFQAFWIVFSVISGLVVYDEAKDMTTASAFMFTVGVMLTVIGVWSLSQRRESTSRPSQVAPHDAASATGGFTPVSQRDPFDEDLNIVEMETVELENNPLLARQRAAALDNTIRVLVEDSRSTSDTVLSPPTSSSPEMRSPARSQSRNAVALTV